VTETRLLGVDLGEVWIGLALSDPLGLTAQPLESYRRVGPRKDLQYLIRLIEEREVGEIVVGLPRLMSGEEGQAAATCREFAAALGRRLPRLRIELWDERLTTVEAERTMIAGGATRRRRRERVDALAAALILQGFLDARRASD